MVYFLLLLTNIINGSLLYPYCKRVTSQTSTWRRGVDAGRGGQGDVHHRRGPWVQVEVVCWSLFVVRRWRRESCSGEKVNRLSTAEFNEYQLHLCLQCDFSITLLSRLYTENHPWIDFYIYTHET